MQATPAWIRIDIPYLDNYRRIRILYHDSDNIQSELFSDLDSARRDLTSGNSKLQIAKDSLVIFPQDNRHALAWSASGLATELSAAFSRHIPADAEFKPEWPQTNEGFECDSSEELLDGARIYEIVRELNQEAHSIYQGGSEIARAIDLLRKAQQLAWHKFGWLDPAATYTLRNYAFVMMAFKNPDSNEDVLRHLRRWHWLQGQDPSGHLDPDAAEFVHQFASIAQRLGDLNLAQALGAIGQKGANA